MQDFFYQFLGFFVSVPPSNVTLISPEDILEWQTYSFTCQATVDKTGTVFLAVFNILTGVFDEVYFGEKTSNVMSVDECKVEHRVTYTMTMDITFNSTIFRCETRTGMSMPGNSSNLSSNSPKYTVLILPSKYKYIYTLILYYNISDTIHFNSITDFFLLIEYDYTSS